LQSKNLFPINIHQAFMSLNFTLTRFVDIIRDSERVIPKGWLFLPNVQEWTIDTQGIVVDIDSLDESEVNENEMPIVTEEKSLIITLDGGTLKSINVCASQLENPPSDRTLLEAFIYYYRFDAFLPELGAADPPQTEVVIHNIDRQFYNSIGEESLNNKCKQNGCDRGIVNFSVFCRVHHFESIKEKPCPFDD
jgi:hypothetical protein